MPVPFNPIRSIIMAENRNQSQQQDGRKDGEFGHGGLSRDEQREAQSRGGQNSHGGRSSEDR
jgi:hypothetical protein